MSLEEALKIIDAYGARERTTHEKIYSAYLRKREELKGSTARVTYEMVRAAYGGGSMGTVAKFLPPIEAVERAKQKAESKGNNSAETASAPKSVPEPVQKKLDAARAALEAICPAIIEANASRDAELAASYQLLIDEQKAALVAELGDVQARNDELEKASIAAGQEAEDRQWQLEELRDRVVAVEAERDAAVAQEQATRHAHEIDCVRLNATESQIATMKTAETVLSAEVSRLQGECQRLAADAERCAELRTQLAVSRNQVANLEVETDRLETIIIETDKRHERERAGVTATRDQELADERQRFAEIEAQLLALIGANGGQR